MKQVFIRKGSAFVEDVPPPCVEDGMILIEVQYSCISAGTELSSIRNTSKPLWKRALDKPEEVKKGLKMLSNQGLNRTRQMIEGRLEAGNSAGYSASGVVVEVGRGVEGFMVGDLVACAGTGYANHAEVIIVPPNLCVKVPENVELSHASAVALGAIALQGVRRADPTIGEAVAVIGLGILGQLTAQILRSNGCVVIGIDIDSERCRVASDLGADHVIAGSHEEVEDQVRRITDGYGADAVIITAGTTSSEVVSQAFKMTRRKGRVVLVGDVGLNLKRSDFYSKEIDFLISTSYGPGRYDSGYEEGGLDYPIGYVRWTEKRNMEQFIRLLASRKLILAPLLHTVFPVEEASRAYELLANSKGEVLIVLLGYAKPEAGPGEARCTRLFALSASSQRRRDGTVRMALVGAGGFAKGMHLPNLRSLEKLYSLRTVISRSGHNAKAVAAQYKAEFCGTDYLDVLNDPDIDAVLIATRHDLHARMVLEFLMAGKHVMVEKPLAITREEVEEIRNYFNERKRAGKETPVLLTGFNRRFSPFAKAVAEEVRNRTNPMIINYRMNAGYMAPDHWVHSPQGGGRNLGEACHIYDLFLAFVQEETTDVKAFSIRPTTGHYLGRDNFQAMMKFRDGSLATLTYTSLGSRQYPKEHMELYVDGKVMNLNDYKRLDFYGNKRRPITTRLVEKGHKEELESFAGTILRGGKWPIPLWQQLQATEIAFRVEDFLTGGIACTCISRI